MKLKTALIFVCLLAPALTSLSLAVGCNAVRAATDPPKPLLEIPLGHGQPPVRVESASRVGTRHLLRVSTALCPGVVRVEARLPGERVVASDEWACESGEPAVGEVELELQWRHRAATLELTAWSGSESGSRTGVRVHSTGHGLEPGEGCAWAPPVDSAMIDRARIAAERIGELPGLSLVGSWVGDATDVKLQEAIRAGWTRLRCASPSEGDGCDYRRARAKEIRKHVKSKLTGDEGVLSSLESAALAPLMLAPDASLEAALYLAKDARRGCGIFASDDPGSP